MRDITIGDVGTYVPDGLVDSLKNRTMDYRAKVLALYRDDAPVDRVPARAYTLRTPIRADIELSSGEIKRRVAINVPPDEEVAYWCRPAIQSVKIR